MILSVISYQYQLSFITLQQTLHKILPNLDLNPGPKFLNSILNKRVRHMIQITKGKMSVSILFLCLLCGRLAEYL